MAVISPIQPCHPEGSSLDLRELKLAIKTRQIKKLNLLLQNREVRIECEKIIIKDSNFFKYKEKIFSNKLIKILTELASLDELSRISKIIQSYFRIDKMHPDDQFCYVETKEFQIPPISTFVDKMDIANPDIFKLHIQENHKLHTALIEKNYILIKFALQKYPELKSTLYFKWGDNKNLIRIALETDDVQFFTMLSSVLSKEEFESILGQLDKDEFNLMHLSKYFGIPRNIFQWLFKKYPNIFFNLLNQKNFRNFTPLFELMFDRDKFKSFFYFMCALFTVENGNHEKIMELCSQTDSNGKTILHYFLFDNPIIPYLAKENIPLLKKLFTAKDSEGNIPLNYYYNEINKSKKIEDFLICLWCNFSKNDFYDFSTIKDLDENNILHIALKNGEISIISFLWIKHPHLLTYLAEEKNALMLTPIAYLRIKDIDWFNHLREKGFPLEHPLPNTDQDFIISLCTKKRKAVLEIRDQYPYKSMQIKVLDLILNINNFITSSTKKWDPYQYQEERKKISAEHLGKESYELALKIPIIQLMATQENTHNFMAALSWDVRMAYLSNLNPSLISTTLEEVPKNIVKKSLKEKIITEVGSYTIQNFLISIHNNCNGNLSGDDCEELAKCLEGTSSVTLAIAARENHCNDMIRQLLPFFTQKKFNVLVTQLNKNNFEKALKAAFPSGNVTKYLIAATVDQKKNFLARLSEGITLKNKVIARCTQLEKTFNEGCGNNLVLFNESITNLRELWFKMVENEQIFALIIKLQEKLRNAFLQGDNFEFLRVEFDILLKKIMDYMSEKNSTAQEMEDIRKKIFMTLAQSIEEEIPEKYCDPLTNQLMTNPVAIDNGRHICDLSTLEAYFKERQRKESPFTCQPLKSSEIIVNIALKVEIDAWSAIKKSNLI